MKKILLTLTLTIFIGTAFSQNANNIINERSSNKITKRLSLSAESEMLNEKQENLPNHRSMAFYSEDFESVTTPALPGNMTTETAETGPNGGGFYTGNAADANVGTYWPVPSHTTFAMCNDDAGYQGWGGAAGGDYNASLEVLKLPEFDFTNESNLFLSFEYYHDQNYGGGDATVETSIDNGTTWVEQVTLSVAEAWQSAAVDLTSFTGTASLSIRITWSDNGTWATGLAIDDIVIDALPDYQLNAIISYPGFSMDPYPVFHTQIPLSQVQNATINATGLVQNFGGLSQSNVALNCEVIQNGTSVSLEQGAGLGSVQSLEFDTIELDGSYSPDALGNYDINLSFSSDSNNTSTESYSFETTTNVFANDAGTPDNFWYFMRADYTLEWVVEYRTYTNWEAKSASVFLDRSSAADIPDDAVEVYFTIYEVDETTFEYNDIAQTPGHFLAAGDYGNWVTIEFDNPVTLEAGKTYGVAIFTWNLASDFSANPDAYIILGSSGTNPCWWTQGYYDYYDSAEWLFGLSDALMIRLNMSSWGIEIDEENESLIQLYPNPVNETFVLSTNITNEDCMIEIYDIMGKKVLTKIIDINSISERTFDVSNLEDGIYFVKITSQSIEETIKILKQ